MDGLTTVIIDDVEAALIVSGRRPTSAVLAAKDDFLTSLSTVLSDSLSVVTFKLEEIRTHLDSMPVFGVSLSLERRLPRRCAILLGDTFSHDEYGVRTVICKPGFSSISDVIAQSAARVFTLEDSCALSGSTLQFVSDYVFSNGRQIRQINVGVASQRALAALAKVPASLEVFVSYPRLKCIELRNLLLGGPQFELRQGHVVQANHGKEGAILGSLPISRLQYAQAVDLVEQTQKRLRLLELRAEPI